jgi:hypothetical protein
MFVWVFYVLYPPRLIVLYQNLAAETAAYLTTKHPDYMQSLRLVSPFQHEKEVIEDLYNYGTYSATRVGMALNCVGSQPEERKAVRHDIEGNT